MPPNSTPQSMGEEMPWAERSETASRKIPPYKKGRANSPWAPQHTMTERT